jgi:hypothetical protein
MKTVFRTLIILVAALAVVASLNAFAQSSLGQSLASAGASGHQGGPPPGLADGSAAGERPEGGEGHGPSLFGLVEVGKNLAIIAVSVTLVALGARMLARGRRDEPRPPTPDQPAPLI